MKKFIFTLIFLLLTNLCLAEIIIVDDDWPYDFNNIQDAIDYSSDGDYIFVFPGTYTGLGNRDVNFLGKAVTVRSIKPNDPNVVAATIIDCNRLGRAFNFTSGEDANSVLTGLTITNGSGHNGGAIYCYNSSPTITYCTFTGNSVSYDGGGLYNNHSSPTINNCTVSGNSADHGGGMYNFESSPEVTNCTFGTNSVEWSGGGMYNSFSNPTITNSTFSDNSGGGMCNINNSNPTVENCTFRNWGPGMSNFANSNPMVEDCIFINNGQGMENSSSSPTVNNCIFNGNYNSGMYNTSNSNPIVVSCIFTGNLTGGGGGGMYNVNSGPKVKSCIFSNNSAKWNGGGMYNKTSNNLIVEDCIFISNSVAKDEGITGHGGAMSNDSSNPAIINCTFVGNTAYGGKSYYGYGGGLYNYSSSPTLANCILWKDAPSEIYCSSGTPIVTYSDIKGGWAGTGNIDADPLFIDANGPDNISGTADDNLRLSFGSPCIDAGDNAAVPVGITTDLDGLGRFVDGDCNNTAIVDMGAFEYQTGIIYVDASAVGANNGSNWNDAYNYLQDALTVAESNNVIWVSQGTYKPDANTSNPSGTGDRTATFQLKNNASIYGGFPTGGGNRDPNTYITTLSGDIGVADDNSDNSYNVVTGSGTNSTAILDGFTITKGNANAYGSYTPQEHGGGMYNGSGNPTINNCTFADNWANYGGGMYNYYSSPTLNNCTFAGDSANRGGGMNNAKSNPTLTNCTITANWAGGYGGGMYNEYSSLTLTNCTFAGNSAPKVGGIFIYEGSPTITNCTFSGNSSIIGGGGGMRNDSSSPTVTNCMFNGNSANSGGGMSNLYSSSPTIINCTFAGNSAATQGGGMDNSSSFSSNNPTITNCTFVGNSATTHGGGMCNFNSGPTVTNCTFKGNSAGDYGGGMSNYSNRTYPFSRPIITNCTIVNNSAPNGPAMACNSYNQSYLSTVVMLDCIVWNGPDWLWNNDQSTITITYSDVQGGWADLGNIDVDPCFVDADANDYHLKSEGWRWDIARQRWDWDDVTSRCIDAGNPGSPLGDELLSVPDDPNNVWGQNLRINMGAFGGTAEASIPPYDWALLGDLTNDGIVDLTDYAYQALDWLNSADLQPGDLNRDSLVDASDLALLIEDWLEQTTWH